MESLQPPDTKTEQWCWLSNFPLEALGDATAFAPRWWHFHTGRARPGLPRGSRGGACGGRSSPGALTHTHTRPQGPSQGCPGPRCGGGASGAPSVRQGRRTAAGQRAAARPLMAAGGQREIAQTPPPSQPPPLPQLAAGRRGSGGLGSARFGSARLGLARLGLSRLGSVPRLAFAGCRPRRHPWNPEGEPARFVCSGRFHLGAADQS